MLPIEDQQAIAKSLSTSALSTLLEDGEVKKFALQCLVDAGCRPPTHHMVLFAITKLAAGAGGVLGGPLLKWLGERLTDMPLMTDFLQKLEGVTASGSARADALAMMRAHLNVNAQAPVPEQAEFDVVQALFAAQRFDDIDGQFDQLYQAISHQLQLQKDQNTAPVLVWPQQHGPIERQSLTDGLRYNSKQDAFIGRDKEIDMLNRFVGDPTLDGPMAMFKWMTLTGPGGEGKTRLAYEYTALLVARGWHAGRLSFADRAHFDPGRWLATKPTFIVVDYASQDGQGTADMLAALSQHAADQACPVRVLLLERDTSGEWFKKIDGTTSDCAAIRGHGAVLDGADLWRGVPLQPLDRNAIIRLMTARYEAARLTAPEPNDLLGAAYRVDPRGDQSAQSIILLPRALFAVATAAKLIRAESDGQDRAAIMAKLNQADVLDFIIERDRTQIWLPAAGSDSSLLQAHENLLALATLCVGLPKSCLATGAEGSGDWLPDTRPRSPSPLTSDILVAMGVANGGQINQLEPDLLGTHFVFDVLDRLKTNGCGGDRALINAAWVIGGDATSEAVLRAMRDAPSRLGDFDFLAPDSASPIAARLQFQRTTVDFTNILGGAGDVAAAYRTLNLAANLLGTPPDKKAAKYVAMACTNVVAYAATAGNWPRVEAALALLAGLREAFPDEAAIALAVAKSCTNFIGDAATAGNWPRVEAALALLAGLRGAFPDDAAIALQVAQSCTNFIGDAATAGEWPRVEAALALLAGLREAFPDDGAIALAVAQSCTNFIGRAATAGNWPRVEAALALLAGLREAFPDDAAIALQVAQSCMNFIGDAATAGEWPRVEAALALLAGLRGAFPDDAAIALQVAKSCTNFIGDAATAGNWPRVEAALALLAGLQGAFPDDAAIALQVAKSCTNFIGRAATAGNWPRVEAALALLAGLREAFPDDAAIALAVAQSCTNFIGDAATAGNWPRVEAALALLAGLRGAFPDEAAIALQVAKSCMNFIGDAATAGEWPRVEAALALLAGLRGAFPDDGAIALAVAQSCTNVVAHAATAGNWPRVEAALALLAGLREAFPEDAAIALAVAKSCTNFIGDAATAGNWPRVEAALALLAGLRGAFPDDAAIALQVAKSCTSFIGDAATAGEWPRVEAALALLAGLREAFPDEAAIALAVAQSCTNFIGRAATAGEWPRVEAALALLAGLREAFPDEAAIALAVAQSCMNFIGDAATAGEWPRVEAALALLAGLRGAFPDDAAIALQVAKSCTNVVAHAATAGNWPRVEAALALLAGLRGAFPDDAAIALQVAQSCTNFIGDAATAGNWLRVEAALALLAGLREAFPDEAAIALQVAQSCTNFIGDAATAGEWPRIAKIMPWLLEPIANQSDDWMKVLATRLEAGLDALIALTAVKQASNQDAWEIICTNVPEALPHVAEERMRFVLGPSLMVLKAAKVLYPNSQAIEQAYQLIASAGADFSSVPDIVNPD